MRLVRELPGQTDAAADRNPYPGGPSDFTAAFLDTTAIPSLMRRVRLARDEYRYELKYQSGLYNWPRAVPAGGRWLRLVDRHGG